jgi:hypothetical protein
MRDRERLSPGRFADLPGAFFPPFSRELEERHRHASYPALTLAAEIVHIFEVKTGRQTEGSKRQRSKSSGAKRQLRATFIGTRPRIFTMTLRGEVVDVEVVPAVGTATHVNFAITITRRGTILDWALTPAELEGIGRAAAMHAKQETSH